MGFHYTVSAKKSQTKGRCRAVLVEIDGVLGTGHHQSLTGKRRRFQETVMSTLNEQLQTRRLHLLREGERRMLVQLHGLMRSTADELNADFEREGLTGEPVTVEQLREVIQSHLFERVHKGDLHLAQSLLQEFQNGIETQLREREPPTEEVAPVEPPASAQ